MTTTSLEDREILSVSDLNRRVRGLIEAEFDQVWVEGEISNFVQPRSGHWYFTLKDDNAQVRCAMFVNRNRMLRFKPQDGMQVILRAKAGLYEGRGEFQLIAENIIDAGEGLLRQKFEELKRKLEAEGLFDARFKKPLPDIPRHIGVVTSSTGAALHDILTVLKRRFPAIHVTLIPTAVQGAEAIGQIVTAIRLAHKLPADAMPLDVLIVGRGGGSLEDLWAFNEEAVARAIFASEIPIVAAVGHEVDFTIADWVADARAPTPSAAAEMLSPDSDEWRRTFQGFEQYLGESCQRIIQQHQHQLTSLHKRLRHPGQQLQDQMQRLDEFEARFRTSALNAMSLKQAQLAHAAAELFQHQPGFMIENMKLKNTDLGRRLQGTMQHALEQRGDKLGSTAQLLHSLSPLQTLNRGYAIVKDAQQKVVSKASHVSIGDPLFTQFPDGQVQSKVESITREAINDKPE